MVADICLILLFTSQVWAISLAEEAFLIKEKPMRMITRIREEISKIKFVIPTLRILFIGMVCFQFFYKFKLLKAIMKLLDEKNQFFF
tara:strand:- start:373 stop:633 length:261 start_codon:yes stop_codon:yes gene_type:complete